MSLIHSNHSAKRCHQHYLGKASGKIKLLEEKIDDMEQSSHNQCILIHRIPEQADKNTDQATIDIFNSKLDLDLARNEIKRSHCLGPKEISTHDTRS